MYCTRFGTIGTPVERRSKALGTFGMPLGRLSCLACSFIDAYPTTPA